MEDGVKFRHPQQQAFRLSHVYFIKGDYIYTGLQNEVIEMSYQCIRTYPDYSPMIPDDEKIKDAIVKYIGMKILYKEFIHKDVDRATYDDARTEYYLAVGAARNKTIEPSLEDMTAISNRMQALLKSTRSHETSGSLWGERYNPGTNKQI